MMDGTLFVNLEIGEGLRSTEDQNTASFIKLAWGVITKPEELWVKVLRAGLST